MLHIFLTILKIPFLLLAVLLLLVLILLALILFVPVRYQALAQKQEGLSVHAKVHWLCRILTVKADFEEKQFSLCVKILGIPVVGGEKKNSAAQPSLEEDSEQSAQQEETLQSDIAQMLTEEEDEKQENSPVQTLTEEDSGQSAQPEESLQSDSIQTPLEKGIEEQKSDPAHALPEKDSTGDRQAVHPMRPGLLQRIRGVAQKIRNTAAGFLEKIRAVRNNLSNLRAKLVSYRDLWYDESTQHAYRHVKKELRYLLRHYLPGKAEGQVLFGTGDPAVTGQILGICSILQVWTENRLEFAADFEEKVLEADGQLRGHIRLCHLLKSGLGLLLDRHVRRTVGCIRRMIQT